MKQFRSPAALQYLRGIDPAPKLVTKGSGKLAESILEAAREAGIPIQEDPDLFSLLMTLNVGEVIPPEMYVAVAEVLAFIYRLDKNGNGH
jgi:flagellar biosynthesis protein